MNERFCKKCNKIKIRGHFNKKYCSVCRKDLRERPKGNLTKEQILYAKKNAGVKTRSQIAKDLKTSISSLKRSCKNVSFNNPKQKKYKSNPNLVNSILRYYEKHGRKKTQEKFPNEKIRSVVEYYRDQFEPRNKKWTNNEFLELNKMAGIISFKDQALFLKRPGANKGSIISIWTRRNKAKQGLINGVSYSRKNDFFLKENVPFVITSFGSNKVQKRKLILWVDAKKYMKSNIPSIIKNHICAMAEHQEKIFNVKDVRRKVLKMIKQRSNYSQGDKNNY